MCMVHARAGLDAAGMASPAARQVQQEEEEGFDSLFNAAEVRIERLWEEVSCTGLEGVWRQGMHGGHRAGSTLRPCASHGGCAL